ncbi:TEA/ATTS domain family-domain-containing protein [Phlebopus sp. FC_14]|nr:TEA/ATTS domain family-domain-containing protein [Phlebopus sp. FC_14]
MEGDTKVEVPASSTLTEMALAAIPAAKFKQSRYEDIWPENVHAAFMEAVALYPPMGKRRLKYYRLPTNDSGVTPQSARVKSFGRCQLIQSYILDKTGKNRSRKQVSSHLQRLKKLHKDNPAMRALFSEPPQPSSDHPVSAQAAVVSADIFSDLSAKNHPSRSMTASSVSSSSLSSVSDNPSASACSSDVPSNGALDCLESPMIHNHAFLSFSEDKFTPQEYRMDTMPPMTFDQSLAHGDEPCLKGFMGGPEPSPYLNMSAFSTSTRRYAPKLPTVGRQLDFPPLLHSVQGMDTPGCQNMHQMLAYDGSSFTSMDLPCNYPLTPTEQVLHTQAHPPHWMRNEKRINDMDRGWTWPVNPDISYSPLAPSLSRVPSLGGLRSEQSLMTQYTASPGTRYESPECYSSPSSESDPSGLARKPTCLQPFCGPSSSYAPSSLSIFRFGISQSIDRTTSSGESLASPLVIKPTPLYAASYTHPENITPEIYSMSPF